MDEETRRLFDSFTITRAEWDDPARRAEFMDIMRAVADHLAELQALFDDPAVSHNEYCRRAIAMQKTLVTRIRAFSCHTPNQS